MMLAKQPFVILGTQRTGSSMVAATLNTHAGINCGWEWALTMSPFTRVYRVMAGLYGDFGVLPDPHCQMMVRKQAADIIGCRLLFSSSPKWLLAPRYNLAHLKERFNPFLDCFSHCHDIKIIHITRKDPIAWLASLFLAKASKLYVNKEYPEKLQITIPLHKAMKRLQAKRVVEEKIRSLETTNPYLEISYEEILADSEKSVSSLFRFLGVVPTDQLPALSFKKQQKRPLSEVISNYMELQQKLAQDSKL